MTIKVGVLVVHGMGNQEATFADGLIRKVSGHLGDQAEEVAWQPLWWAPVLAQKEADLTRALRAGGDLDLWKMREFVLNSFGDAVAYQRVPSADRMNVYEEIHARVAATVQHLRDRIREGQPPPSREVPLIVVAHSLGCHILSNYIWDVQKDRHPRPSNPFECFETLAGLFTFGCNIPLFALAHARFEPIEFPPRGLERFLRPGVTPQEVKAAARWLNVYDPDDVLGYPLKPLGESYARTVSEDIPRDVGNPFISWTPLSHNAYWTDGFVTKRLAGLIRGVAELV